VSTASQPFFHGSEKEFVPGTVPAKPTVKMANFGNLCQIAAGEMARPVADSYKIRRPPPEGSRKKEDFLGRLASQASA
jgi:hypothetical protein